jgi:hypothetical protein
MILRSRSISCLPLKFSASKGPQTTSFLLPDSGSTSTTPKGIPPKTNQVDPDEVFEAIDIDCDQRDRQPGVIIVPQTVPEGNPGETACPFQNRLWTNHPHRTLEDQVAHDDQVQLNQRTPRQQSNME